MQVGWRFRYRLVETLDRPPVVAEVLDDQLHGTRRVHAGAQLRHDVCLDFDRDRRGIKRGCQIRVATSVYCDIIRQTGCQVAFLRRQTIVCTTDGAVAPVEALLRGDDHGTQYCSGSDLQPGRGRQDLVFEVVDQVGDRVAGPRRLQLSEQDSIRIAARRGGQLPGTFDRFAGRARRPLGVGARRRLAVEVTQDPDDIGQHGGHIFR